MRLGEADDICLIKSFIDELAAFENASDAVTITPMKLLRNGWQSSRPYFYAIIVESTTPASSRREGVGMAFFYAIHSTWTGPAIYIEDLYIREAYQQFNLSPLLLKLVSAVALSSGHTSVQCACGEGSALHSSFSDAGGMFQPCQRGSLSGDVLTVLGSRARKRKSDSWGHAFEEAVNKVNGHITF